MKNEIINQHLEHIERQFLKLTTALSTNNFIIGFDEFNVLTSAEAIKLKYYIIIFSEYDIIVEPTTSYQFLYYYHIQFKQQIERKRTELLTQYFEVKKMLN